MLQLPIANVLRDSQQSPTFLQDRVRVMIASSQASGDGLLTVIAIRGRAVKGLSLADHLTPDALPDALPDANVRIAPARFDKRTDVRTCCPRRNCRSQRSAAPMF